MRERDRESERARPRSQPPVVLSRRRNERTLRSMEKDLQDLVAEQQQLKRGGSRAATAASERDRLMARPGAAASAASPAYGAPASEDVTIRDGRVDVQATMRRHEEAMKGASTMRREGPGGERREGKDRGRD